MKVEFSSIYGAKSKAGLVGLTITDDDGDVRVRMLLPLDKAREIRNNLSGAIEAAVSDALIVRFLIDKVGLTEEKATLALIEFREMRQGSRSTVYPT